MGNGRPPVEKLHIGDVLRRLEKERKNTPGYQTENQIAAGAEIPPKTYKNFKAKASTSPTLAHLIRLARYFRVPIDTFLAEVPLATYAREGVRFRLVGGAVGEPAEALRLAAISALLGESPEQTARVIEQLPTAGGVPGGRLSQVDVRRMVRGGLALPLVELVLSESRSELQDETLAAELREALMKASSDDRVLDVRVVRNLAHPAYRFDPLVPFFIAYVAHLLVADFLTRNRDVYEIGIAGGIHVATFVRTMGALSSPFPQLPGADRRFTIAPLTLEPFVEHRFCLADSLVGELESLMTHLLGQSRVHAPTFHPDANRRDPSGGMREHYSMMRAAIFGCGDCEDDGWIRHILKDLGIDLDTAPLTDVILNLLTADGEPIELPEALRPAFMGADLRHLRDLASGEGKLALLLTSGASKGRPLAVVARAGYANAIVCDQAAAHAALDALD